MEILARYLIRKAIVYLRQSTDQQVRRNEGSRQYQEGQVEHARHLGWADHRIVVLDADLGRSGTNTDRPGYQELLRLMRKEEVGALFISDVSRAGRREQAWFDLLELLEQEDVLLFVDGRLTDPHDSGQVFVKKIEAVTMARDNRLRTETVHRGRLAKARGGRAVSAPPVGYLPDYETREGVPVKTGKWRKDPDKVKQIDAVFAAFREHRSLPRTVRALLARQVMVPSWRGLWVKPTVGNIHRFIRHLGYCGDYVYGKKHWRRVTAGAPPEPPERLFGQYVVLENHHEGYITREEYAENQNTLKLNHNAPWRSSLGPGPALLPGRIRCALHGAMVVHYSGQGTLERWSFRCLGTTLAGGRYCISTPGRAFEARVVEAILHALSGSIINDAKRIWRTRQREWVHAQGGVQREIEQAEQRLLRLKRQVLEPREGRLSVRIMLEEEYERLAQKLVLLKTRGTQEEHDADPFTEEKWEELTRLCESIHLIWNAPTTDIQDRQQLVRIVVDRVVIDTVDHERVCFHIVWADGRPVTPLEILRPPYFHRVIWEGHAADKSIEEIVRELDLLGARTQQGRPWGKETVQRTTMRLIKQAARRSHQPGSG